MGAMKNLHVEEMYCPHVEHRSLYEFYRTESDDIPDTNVQIPLESNDSTDQ